MKQQTAIVTGAAKGIGHAIAKRMADDGYFVILIDVDKEQGEKAATAFGSEKAKFISCDISKENEVISLFKNVMNDYGQVNVLVNNAGIVRDNMIWKMSAEDYDKVIDVNLKGVWLMCKEAAIVMREQKSGRIINISSRGWLGNIGQTNYVSSKAGIVGLSRALAIELGRNNILVNTVAPGLIDTPMVQNMPEDARDRLIQAQPTKAMGKPEDVANAVAFLSSEKTQFITGQIIYVDGGKSIGAGI